MGVDSEGGDHIHFTNPRDHHEAKGIPQESYISSETYLRRISLMQGAIYEVLHERKKNPVEGNEVLEGFFIEGSYGKSHPAFGSKIWVHDAAGDIPASDVDIAPIISKHETLPWYQMTSLQYPYDWNVHLNERLAGSGFAMDIDVFDSFGLTSESDNLQWLLNDDIRRDGGLLFVDPASPMRERILTEFKTGNTPTILDPATTAQRLR